MDRDQLIAAIEAQESLRGSASDEIIDTTVDALRRQLSFLDANARRRRQVTLLFADISGFTSMSYGIGSMPSSRRTGVAWTSTSVTR